MLWSRKQPAPSPDRQRCVGVDLNASRIRAVALSRNASRALLLDGDVEEIALFLACDRRTPEAGQAGYTICRKLAHVTCSNFLSAIAQPCEWRVGRHVLNAESALEIALAKLRAPAAAEADELAMGMPVYLSSNQVAKIGEAAGRQGIKVKGTTLSALALAASRANRFLNAAPAAAEPAEWVVPLRPPVVGPGLVVVVDVDEFATTAAAIAIDRDAVVLVASASWPRAGMKAWKDRLIDAVSDRCVRLCRRDPRDSATAEQSLFEQLDHALERTRQGARSTLTIRTDHWYQDLVYQPDDFDGSCIELTRVVVDGIRDMLSESSARIAPRAIWLTAAAGRLPGLGKGLKASIPEGAEIEILSRDEIARSLAALIPRWLSGNLPRTHLDTAIPLAADDVGFTEAQSIPR